MFRIIFYLIQLLTLLVVIPFLNDAVDTELILIIISIALINTCVFFIAKENVEYMKRRFFKHSVIFIIGFLILHFQFPLDLILGNLTTYYNKIFLFDDVINISVVYGLIGLLSFFVGYEVAKVKKSKSQVISNAKWKVNRFVLLDLGALLSLVIYFATVNPAYVLGNYGSVPMGVTAGYASIGIKLFVFASLIQQTINIKERDIGGLSFLKFLKSLSIVILIVVILYLATVLISGDRGPLIYFNLFILGCFLIISKKRIKPVIIISSVIASAFLITLLSIVRSKGNEGQDFIQKIEFALEREGYRDFSVSPQTAELAFSINTLHTAVKFVPERNDFFYGEFQLKMLLGTIPFLPTVINEVVNKHEYSKYGTSSQYFTNKIHGDHPEYGMGSSVLADLYVDFGIIGILIGMILFGYFIRYAELSMYGPNKSSIFLLILMLVYFSQALYINRSMILFELSTVVKIFIIFKINTYLSQTNT